MFTDRLIDKIIKTQNHSIVGIDPHENIIPRFLWDSYYEDSGKRLESISEILFQFSKEIIDNIYDIVPAIKPQIAFFERYGSYGLMAFERVCDYAMKKDLIVIGDVKRGDIGSTAEAYSHYYLGNDENSISVDAITVNPYLGSDSIEPFVKDCIDNKKGLFVLVKTSNKSSGEIQNLSCNGKKIYEIAGDLVVKLGNKYIGDKGYSPIGAVVGATYKEEGEQIRKIMKNCYFLVPGYGAQGAKASDLGGFFNDDGLGAIINSSRGIIGAHKLDKYKDLYDEKSFGAAARKASIDMKNDINSMLEDCKKIAW